MVALGSVLGVSPPTLLWGSPGVVLGSPVFDDEAGFGEGSVFVDVEQFVA